MDANGGQLQGINYSRLLSWVHLFRAFRIAVDFRKMILAGLALIALSAGNQLFSNLPFAPDPVSVESTAVWPWQEDLGVRDPLDIPRDFTQDPLSTLSRVVRNWQVVLRPLMSILEPGAILFTADSSWSQYAFAWTQLLWALFVWAFFGGAITRMAAVQFARDEKVGMRSALTFAGNKFVSYLAAPLLPLFGIGLLWLLCLVGGLIGRIPWAGDVIVGALFVIPLALAFVMTLILLGVAAGWPLMFAAVSTEGSDGFDAFSRSYSYVYSRPWHYFWFALVAMVYGSVAIFFVSLVASLLVYLAGWGVAAGMGLDGADALFQGAPEILGGPDLLHATSDAPLGIGTLLAGLWLHLLSVVVLGFVYSYFWSAATIIYFLLRRSDDATDLDEVYLPDEDEEDELVPLVGAAKSDQEVIERPPAEPSELDPGEQGEIFSGDTELDIKPDSSDQQ